MSGFGVSGICRFFFFERKYSQIPAYAEKITKFQT